ncbi:MAG: hypothetical protein ABIH76_08095 [Candidatus Bathyarchaeota archaeon]
MSKCKNCGKENDDLTLLLAEHSKRGKIMICRECWITLYDEKIICSTY